MLRVTVSRESATESTPIGEVVIGKFAGSEQRGGYAARVLEPPSPYSDGIDACFTVRGHERYQPAMALVASVLGAWSEGRVDAVGEGVRSVLANTPRPAVTAAATAAPAAAGDRLAALLAALARLGAGNGQEAETARHAAELLRGAVALAESLTGGAR